MKTSHWVSNVPAGSRLKATRLLPTSAAAPFPSGHLGKPWKALHSAACSVFFILEEATNASLKAPFPLQKYVFPSLLLLTIHYLTANKNHRIEVLARDKSPAFYCDSCVDYLCSLFRGLVTHWSSTEALEVSILQCRLLLSSLQEHFFTPKNTQIIFDKINFCKLRVDRLRICCILLL